MAAGRHGGYRDNGFRDRESSLDVSRRGYANSKEDYDWIRTGSRDSVGGGDTDARDRIRVRQKDVREREAMNGSYHSSPSRSDSGSSSGGLGPRKCGFSVKATDRESGELSSDSGSDEAQILCLPSFPNPHRASMVRPAAFLFFLSSSP